MKIETIAFTDPRYADCRRIRDAVFVREQRIPVLREIDGLDPDCTHYLFYQGDNAIGAARSRIAGDHLKIERFAFLPDCRGSGLGAIAFTAIVNHLKQTHPGLDIEIGAQAYLQNFYQRLGFKACGPVFQDAGIDHVAMIYKLT